MRQIDTKKKPNVLHALTYGGNCRHNYRLAILGEHNSVVSAHSDVHNCDVSKSFNALMDLLVNRDILWKQHLRDEFVDQDFSVLAMGSLQA